MKTSTATFCFLLLLSSCLKSGLIQETESAVQVTNVESLNGLSETFEALKENSIEKSLSENEFGRKVKLYPELVNLFDPNQFICNCNPKLIKAMNGIKSKRNNDTKGFIPQVVLKNVDIAEDVYLIEKAGSAILAHLFQFKQKDGKNSGPISARAINSKESFSLFDYLERGNETFSNFIYTLDCSGYLSLAISVAAGVNVASLKSSAGAASSSSTALVIIGGVMYSPLYLAYKGEGIFSENDSNTLTKRLSVLKRILSSIPEEEKTDTTEVFLTSNYRVLVTSNSGSSSFNGKGELEGKAGGNFGVFSASIEGGAKGTLGRKAEFTQYNTYIIDKNLYQPTGKITVSSIMKVIQEIKEQQRQLIVHS